MNPSKSKAFANRRPKSKSIPKHHDGREYVVCLKDGIDYDTFWNEMETTIASPAEIPDRAVRVANERPNMKRICHYILTDEEAKRLRADSRVVSVDTPVEHKDGVVMIPHASQTGNFSKPANVIVSTGSLVNWGLIRGNATDNVYGTSTVIDTTYDYTLTGSNVDVVIVDTGIQANHPEWTYIDDSETRLQQINWFDASGTSPDFVQANNNQTNIVVTADSEILFNNNVTDAKLQIGKSDLAVENFSIQTENDGRARRMRFVGDSAWYASGFNNVKWEVKLLDNNWIQVAILRHDAATRVDVEGIIQTTGDTSIVVKDIDTTDLFEGQLIRFAENSHTWSDYHGTIRELGTYDGSSLIRTYVIDYLENTVIGDLDDLIVGLRLERQTDLNGGSIDGDALITELNLNGNEVNYTADGSTVSYLVANRPINNSKITVLLDGSLTDNYQVIYDDRDTYIVLNSTPANGLSIEISFPPSLVFETTDSCDEGPLVFNARTAGSTSNDFLIDSIDNSTQITMSGYAGGSTTHGYAYMYVGSQNPNPSWTLTNEYNDVIIDLSDLADSSLFGPGATPVSFLLKSDNNGVTWTRQGGIGNNYRAALVNNVWTAQAGLAVTSNTPLSTVSINQYYDYREASFNTPFSFKAPFTGFVPALHYTDIEGHGTHVAGIAAGKTYGWAKDAYIYALKMKDLSGNGGLSEAEMFDAIIGWHNNKTNGRPTVVNMSWGYGGYYEDFYITGGRYRGLDWSDSAEEPEYGMGDLGSFPIRNSSTDTGIEEMIAAGIHVCISSGNDGVKIDVPGGPDYDNLFRFTDGEQTDFYYYQKGSSPYSKHALMVGSLDLEAYDVNQDQKAAYSNGGPGTDIYAAGTGILSSMSTVNTLAAEGYQSAPYHLNTSYKQANLSGTSMASPQLAGMVALWLQANPHATPAQMKAWVLANATDSMFDANSNGMDYQTTNSPWGGATKVAYNKFNSANNLLIQNVIP